MTHPTGTVTFLFTDIEGSTKLAQGHPDKWESLQQRHHAILQSAMDAHNGFVFQIIGDAFCVAFHTASDGLNAALQAQRTLQTEAWGDTPIKVRIGIHTGKAELQEGNDYKGYLTFSRVQRLMSAGHGGQIIISLATQELVRDELPVNVTLQDMGNHRLKDLIHPEHIFQVNAPDLPSTFPALKTLDAQLNNLPTQLTPFVGRDREITAVVGLLHNPDVHLVTLTGPGGTGKTRLSLHVAADLLDEFEQGVWFIELASITDPELVLSAIASTLKIKESAGMTIEQTLQEHLRTRQMLLVLDNFEQVVNAATKIGSLLNAAAKVKILVSSREVLRLRGEYDYPVPPLGLPETKRKQKAAVLAQYEAIALFVQHARAANSAFVLDDKNASIVADICSRLDGLPLALELAAARSRLLKPAAMLEKLKNKLDTLTGGARDLPRRQQTIRGAIDWSYDLLDDAEKVLFARLGIFVGGWTLDSAEAVCGSGSNVDTLNGIESLLDKSLIRQVEGTSGETRFTMLETIREYAREKLSQSGELESIQQAHAKYIEQFSQKVVDAQTKPEEATWFSKLDEEIDNLRAAVEWTLTRQQPSLAFKAGRLFRYWDARVNFREPMNWMERGLQFEQSTDPTERWMTLMMMSAFLADAGYHNKDNLRRAREYTEFALALSPQLGDKNMVARCLNSLGNIAWREKDVEKAHKFIIDSLDINPKTDLWGYAVTLMNLGSLEIIRGNYKEAQTALLRGRDVCTQIDYEAGVAFMEWKLCILALAERKLDEALTYIQDVNNKLGKSFSPVIMRAFHGYDGYIQLLLGNQMEAQKIMEDALSACLIHVEESSILPGEPGDFWFIFDGKARLELMDGNYERAAILLGVAWTQREDAMLPPTAAERPDYESCIVKIRSKIGDAAFETAFAKGQAMQIKAAIEFALGIVEK